MWCSGPEEEIKETLVERQEGTRALLENWGLGAIKQIHHDYLFSRRMTMISMYKNINKYMDLTETSKYKI